MINYSIQKTIFNYKKLEERPTIYVLLGFDKDTLDIDFGLKPIFSEKYLSLQSFLDKDVDKELYTLIFPLINSGHSYYCFFEQFIFLNSDFVSSFFEIKYLNNIFYRNYIPFNLCIPDELDLSIYDDENEGNNFSHIEQKLFNSFSKIINLNNSLYFIPSIIPENINDIEPEINFSSNMNNRKNSIGLTISDDGESWISFISMIEENLWDNINLSISSYYIKNELIEHCRKVSSFFNVNLNFNENDEIKLNRKSKFLPMALKKLSSHWGYEDFRDFNVYSGIRNNDDIKITKTSQSNVIVDILEQVENSKNNTNYRDLFVTAPTGTGKSLMFQIPSMILSEYNYLTLIISPLIGLMNDQINGLEVKGVTEAATINSSLTPNDKQEIIQKVKDGEISILYLSPESLLSRSDISMLIGKRQIGLLVIDEAHIVTTWGKAFRPDYWYLGNYIQKLRKSQKFPIVTFTATSIYKGPEDMYSETRDSLSLIDPITYFGVVPREDIDIYYSSKSEDDLRNKKSGYQNNKMKICIGRLEELRQKDKKVLVYFPYVSLVRDFLDFITMHDNKLNLNDITKYYGSLRPDEKHENFISFKNGKTNIMLATKAFGMGIDIPDIDVVYHYAPTGNVCDYIQEIGRCARDKNIQGMAVFDYLKRDFSYVNKLHGISSIKPYQLIEVVRKIYDLGKQKDFSRNLLICSEDFIHIFNKSNSETSKDDLDEIDRKLKTTLLIIEKDFIQKLGYSPIVARPRNLFTRSWFRITRDNIDEKTEILKQLKGYYSFDNSNLIINIKKLWEDKYKENTFASFKYNFYSDQTFISLPKNDSLTPIFKIEISDWKGRNAESESSAKYLIDSIMMFIENYKLSGKWFNVNKLTVFLKDKYKIYSGNDYRTLAETILSFISTINYNNELNNGRFILYREDSGYRISNSGYLNLKKEFMDVLYTILENRGSYIFLDQDKNNNKKNAKIFAVLGLLDTARICSYQVSGGLNPEIFVQVVSYFQIRRMIYNSHEYSNIILNNVSKRHKVSVKFLDYLFSKYTTESNDFWKHIENYFLGELPEDLQLETDKELVKNI